MRDFVLNILLTLAWCALNGNFDLTNLLIGFGLGLVVIHLSKRAMTERPPDLPQAAGKRPAYLTKAVIIVRFIFWFLKELIIANFRVAYEISTPSFHMQPGVVGIPLDIKTDAEITLLANLITLTPGTLSLDVSEDRQILYIHTMYIEAGDVEAFKRDIKENFEKRVMEVFA